MGVGEVNYCLESGLCFLFGSSGTKGSMKGRRSEVGCCHTVMRGDEGGVAFFIKLVEIIILQISVLVICTLTIKMKWGEI